MNHIRAPAIFYHVIAEFFTKIFCSKKKFYIIFFPADSAPYSRINNVFDKRRISGENYLFVFASHFDDYPKDILNFNPWGDNSNGHAKLRGAQCRVLGNDSRYIDTH